VRVEVEDGVFGQFAVAVHERGGVVELAQRPPDRLMDAQRVRILDESGEQQVERVLGRDERDAQRPQRGNSSPL
jgi:hypothetical protein